MAVGDRVSGGPKTARQQRAPSNRSQRALDWLNFFIADTETAFGPFVALYLAQQGWQQGKIGTAIAVNSGVALAMQVPAGWLIDQTHSKRLIIAVGLACIGAGSLVVSFFPAYLPVLLAQALLGSSGATLRTAIAAVALGLVGHRSLHTRIGRNHRYLSFGNALTAAVMGVLGQYSSARAPFLAAAGLCLPAAAALAFIRADEIDYNRARQAVGRSDEGAARWREILQNRSLHIFAICLLLFQFANAWILPLATERLSAQHRSVSELITAGFVMVPQVVTAIIAAWLARKADEAGRKMLLMAAFAALLTQSVLFAINLGPWFLLGVQVLGGLTAAVIGILTPLVVADVTRRSGRYNFSLGAVAMAGGIGATVSKLVSGFIVQAFGFLPGFLLLACVTLAAMAVLWLWFPETVEAARTAEA
jgi:MFS family permease